MEAVVDTSLLVYEAVEDSELHGETVEKLGSLALAHIPSNVLVELVLVLAKLGADTSFIREKIWDILSNPGAKLEQIPPATWLGR